MLIDNWTPFYCYKYKFTHILKFSNKMDVKTKLSIHFNYVNKLDSKNPDFVEYKKHILKLISNIEKKHLSVQELKTYYVDELDCVIKDVCCLGRDMGRIDQSIKPILEPVKCFENDLTFDSWGPRFHAINTVSAQLAFKCATSENLNLFSSRLFNLMSLYTHVCTSLSDLSRFDKETEAQLNVLNDKINNLSN